MRGLPSAFGVGRQDRKRAHWASERSVGYVFLTGESVQNFLTLTLTKQALRGCHTLYSPRIREGCSGSIGTFRPVSERLSEKGTSNGPSEDLAAIRRPKWTEMPLLGGPLGYAGSASETFRTVSRRGLLGNQYARFRIAPHPFAAQSTQFARFLY